MTLKKIKNVGGSRHSLEGRMMKLKMYKVDLGTMRS
jgi:hypothetical protein